MKDINLGTSSSMNTRRGFSSDGLHFINSCRQLCRTLTGVTMSAVFNPRSTLLIAVYKKAMTCTHEFENSGKLFLTHSTSSNNGYGIPKENFKFRTTAETITE